MCQYLLITGIGWTIAVGARVVALCRRVVRRKVSSQPSPVAVSCELRQPPECASLKAATTDAEVQRYEPALDRNGLGRHLV
jgi:hypothetical protein